MFVSAYFYCQSSIPVKTAYGQYACLQPIYVVWLFVMALSKTQKTLRAIALGQAIRRLRKDLGLSQEGLVKAVGHKLDAGMVSRWERAAAQAQKAGRRSGGACSPSPDWRKFLAAFARRRGCLEVAAAFEAPLLEWKAVVLSPEDRRLIALFEIVVLNKPAAPDAWPPVLPWDGYERAVQAVEEAAGHLKRNQGRAFPPARGRWGATTLTEEQAALWLRETDRHGSKRPVTRAADSDDLVIRRMDGTVEIRKDDARKENARGRAKG